MAGLVRVRREADGVALVARVDLDEGACVDRPLAVRRDADHDVRGRLLDAEERVRRLPVLPGDRDHLRAVGVRAEQLHVVRAAEVLPARVAELAVVAHEERDRVREALREEVTVGVAARDGDGRELRDDARVLVLVGAGAHRRIHLVRRERDLLAGKVDRVEVVLRARRQLVDLVLAGRVRRQGHRVDVVVVARVLLHREDDRRRVEREVRAVEVRRRKARGEVGHRAVDARWAEEVEAPTRLVPRVVDDLAVAAGDVDRGRARRVGDRRHSLDEDDGGDIRPCGAARLRRAATGHGRAADAGCRSDDAREHGEERAGLPDAPSAKPRCTGGGESGGGGEGFAFHVGS